VKRIRDAGRYVAIVAGMALSLAAAPASAQTSGGYYPSSCRTINGHFVCNRSDGSGGAAGGHAYERWDNGSAATGSSAPERHYYPHSWGGYSTWYGFGH
jgi:hypothetical protein